MSAADPFVITSRERAKYAEQFKSLQPVNGVVTGAQAKGFFLQSQLPPLILGQIWALADTDSDGKMTLGEFSIACKLINLKLRGFEVPKTLPPTLVASLTAVGGTPTLTPTTGLSPLDPLKSLGNTISNMPPAVPPQPAMAHVPHAIVPPMMSNQMPGMVQQPLISAVPPARPTIPPQPLIATAAQPPLIPMQPLIPQAGVVPQQHPGSIPPRKPKCLR